MNVDNYIKWMFITIIVGIITFGVYKTTELVMDRTQQIASQVIER